MSQSKKLKMRMVHYLLILASILNPNQMQAGHWMKERPDSKNIEERNSKIVKSHDLPLRMCKCLNMLARHVLSI